MTFTAKKMPSMPSPQRLGSGLLLDILTAIKSNLDIRFRGTLGSDDMVVLRGDLGSLVTDFTVVTSVRMSGGTLQKKTRSIGIENGIVTILGDETDWVNA